MWLILDLFRTFSYPEPAGDVSLFVSKGSVMILSFLFSLTASVCFILALRGLSSAKTAQAGSLWGIGGMALALGTTLILGLSRTGCSLTRLGYIVLALGTGGGIGAFIAKRIQMTALPQLVAAFHSLVGAAAVLIAWATLISPEIFRIGRAGALPFSALLENGLGAFVGALTFTGSIVAFLKLQGTLKGTRFVPPHPHGLNAALGGSCLVLMALFLISQSLWVFGALVAVALVLGAGLILPVGGADMPVVVSMLNSYSGWAAAATGFTLNSPLLIITGALVGSSGAILSTVMCRNMNRSILNVLFGGGKAGGAPTGSDVHDEPRPVKIGQAEDAAFVLENASTVIIVPGYGMAVAQAQRALHEMVGLLQSRGVKVRYAIHPVAGRMPGHMNVLLAEAGVPYDEIFELDDINGDFSATDVAFVIGANDITNPAAHDDSSSPIYGMPVLHVEEAGTVLFVKRSLGAGYAGIENDLFYRENTMMILGDAKKVCEEVVRSLKAS